ncbi:hypothetical protein EST38_g7704 [Candolleomyces aberdarensis]|uniref:Ricin B lectin domain-containing protein n=1 Tax=Candolleomyces aberdarensis TaxID=2316362 RepID=A0A4Q2DEZ9_9AGAR|nr:hypothetical protein EST38_g7704 [Candolleomyces aberdarensis]
MKLEEGRIYKFISFRTGSAVTLRCITGNAVGDKFEGNQNQLWEAQTTPTGFWCFKNVQHGLYLGIEKGEAATNGLAIRGVSHPFDWAPKNGGSSPASFKLFIPFTKQVLNLDSSGGWANGIKIESWSDSGSDGQKWVINTDTTFEAPLEAGKLYKIVGCHAGTVVHLEDNKKVAGYKFNDGRNQKWKASQDERTGYWFFKNPWSGLYMGIASDTAEAGNGTRIVGVPQPFAWDVVPNRTKGANGKSCRGGCEVHSPVESGGLALASVEVRATSVAQLGSGAAAELGANDSEPPVTDPGPRG